MRRAGPLCRRLLAASLVGAALVSGAAPWSSSRAAADAPAVWVPSEADYYVNYVAPRDDLPPDPHAVDTAASARIEAATRQAQAVDRKFADGNPPAARGLAAIEAEASATGKSPREIRAENERRAGLDPEATHEARLLTILVEFNDQANDDFSGFTRPTSVADPTCVTEPPGTVMNGPLHNRLPDPAGSDDNNSMWVPDFSPAYYNATLYSETGLTERVRPDLTGPDGQPGVDLTGLTMRNFYQEMSKGAYSVGGEAAGWVKVPHSEAWYAAGHCDAPRQDNSGHPDNPRGVRQFVTDAVDALAAAQPDFPWADYDKEDLGDADHDGNLREPDGVIDHLVLVHAGRDKSAGGGAEGTYAIWAHAGNVLRGHQVPGTDLKVANYIVQPEDSGVGVFAHEFGHDLGLPDLYDNFSGGESDVDFWDLMASGSHSGPLFQSLPAHMGAWSKYVLGWTDPQRVEVDDPQRAILLGSAAKPHAGTRDSVRVDLPPETVRIGTPHSGSGMWYSGRDQEWADTAIVRDVTVPAGAQNAAFWMWNDYVIEEDWDFGFVEVSTDGGATWRQLPVVDEAGTPHTTPPDYRDPNRNLAEFRKTDGLTGDSGGWRHDRVDLTPYAGRTVQVRLGLMTDAAFAERGWFADDFSLVVDGATVWSDDVESDDAGWRPVLGTSTITRGEGWSRTSGSFEREQYYLLEWRTPTGFDEGLRYAYTTVRGAGDGQGTKVARVPYNVPGLLVWLRDTEYQNNGVRFSLDDPPSHGPKGSVLLVDAHVDPLRWSGEAGDNYTGARNPLKNLENRAQSSNAAFSPDPTAPFEACHTRGEWCQEFPALPGQPAFTDARGWAAGVEYLDGQPVDRFRDGGTVVPARAPYSTRVVLPDGSPDTAHYGVPYGGSELGTGDPGTERAYGVTVRVASVLGKDRGAVVYVVPARR
ncbi:immune inhibitor A [Yinghuangia sp. ASG 101]|uniref:immune inhibitor A domain-containing protein n=1 Tax=Yinghuangia sp. ASG 101 TaxID=2896848 RepID=UPI001E283DB9|nr:immune inhibitor A domain-containing protein [Yinghuangia sp. ASG 101]UGQ09413.1 immune inhibitor A [Yinghuangia sp. ASG 101]